MTIITHYLDDVAAGGMCNTPHSDGTISRAGHSNILKTATT